MSKFTSNAEWPAEAGVQNNHSDDNHDSEAAAVAVCRLLRANGFGGDRNIRPVRTWVEQDGVEIRQVWPIKDDELDVPSFPKDGILAACSPNCLP